MTLGKGQQYGLGEGHINKDFLSVLTVKKNLQLFPIT